MGLVAFRHGNVFHIINLRTRFNHRGFINKLCLRSTWKTLRKFLIDVYAGAPDNKHIDVWSSSKSSVFRKSAKDFGTTINVPPTEAHNNLRVVERSRAFLRTSMINCVWTFRTLREKSVFRFISEHSVRHQVQV